MTDEQIRKAKYKCLVVRGIEGLTVADLFIKTANGAIMRPVILKKDDYIQTNVLDFEDLKKSRLAGSLKRCVDSGIISEEIEGEEVVVTATEEIKLKDPTSRPGITEIQAGTVSPENISNPISDAAKPSPEKVLFDPFPEDSENPVKIQKSLKDSRRHNTFAITEGDEADKPKAANYKDFGNLKYFQKLKVIKESTDKPFLEEITSRSDYPQLVHNARKRLDELKEIKT